MFCAIFLPQRQLTMCLHRIKNLRQRNLVNKTSKCLRQNLLKTQKAEMRKKHKHKRLLLQRQWTRKICNVSKRGNAVKRQNNAQKYKDKNAENLTGKFEKIASKQKRSETQRNEKPPRRKSDD